MSASGKSTSSSPTAARPGGYFQSAKPAISGFAAAGSTAKPERREQRRGTEYVDGRRSYFSMFHDTSNKIAPHAATSRADDHRWFGLHGCRSVSLDLAAGSNASRKVEAALSSAPAASRTAARSSWACSDLVARNGRRPNLRPASARTVRPARHFRRRCE